MADSKCFFSSLFFFPLIWELETHFLSLTCPCPNQLNRWHDERSTPCEWLLDLSQRTLRAVVVTLSVLQREEFRGFEACVGAFTSMILWWWRWNWWRILRMRMHYQKVATLLPCITTRTQRWRRWGIWAWMHHQTCPKLLYKPSKLKTKARPSPCSNCVKKFTNHTYFHPCSAKSHLIDCSIVLCEDPSLPLFINKEVSH